MPKRSLSRPELDHIKYLRAQVRKAQLTIHSRLRRVNIPASLDTTTLPEPVRNYLRELLAAGYQLQLYIPSANPRQDQESKELTGPTCLRAAA